MSSTWLDADGSDVGSMTSLAACLKDLEHVTESEFRKNSPAAALQKPVDRITTDVSSSSSPMSGDTYPDIARLSTLSAQLVEEERWEEALKVVVEEHDLASRAYGDAHDHTLQALATYAGVLWQLDRGQDARELLDELVQKRAELAEAIDADAPERAAADESLADALVELSTVSRPSSAACIALSHILEGSETGPAPLYPLCPPEPGCVRPPSFPPAPRHRSRRPAMPWVDERSACSDILGVSARRSWPSSTSQQQRCPCSVALW